MSKKPYIPDDLPVHDINWQEILPLVGEANRSLARYDGMMQTLPNPDVLLSPITAREAVLSSKIEGTQATFDEVLEADAGMILDEGRKGDIEEITNYREAVRLAESALISRSVSLGLVREIHQRLLQGVRGRNKEPGSFRQDQNWIGRPGDAIEQARFIPPSPLILMEKLQNWENYLGLEGQDPVLLTAIAHAQFEILHPFKDGNGRIGRMLIPLILYKRKALSAPMFYMSEYLEANRTEYYDQLLAITETGSWHSWVHFFLHGLIAQAEENLKKVQDIRNHYDEIQQTVVEITHSQFSHAVVDAFFGRPIISGPMFAQMAGFNHRVTANGILKQLEDGNVITKIREGAGRSPAIYALHTLINLMEGKDVFKRKMNQKPNSDQSNQT
ncbi:Fic domain protein, Pden_3305 type [hydrothermal vent metagenome]|uniref:Fic domain protein, Pden_3305 type n=1 Tax=hydrothermal vent metagenome TaxID=652676 RepID=A0A3B0RVQ8_9ZZZZ